MSQIIEWSGFWAPLLATASSSFDRGHCSSIDWPLIALICVEESPRPAAQVFAGLDDELIVLPNPKLRLNLSLPGGLLFSVVLEKGDFVSFTIVI